MLSRPNTLSFPLVRCALLPPMPNVILYKVTGLHWGVDVVEQLSEFEALKEVTSREGGM
jgi:hypothetical protein